MSGGCRSELDRPVDCAVDGGDVQATLVLPIERDRPDLHAFHRSAEVAGASDFGGHRLVERPPPRGIAMPDRGEALTDRRRGPAAQAEDMSRAEWQAHDAVAGHPLAGCRRKLRVFLDLTGERGRFPHAKAHRSLTSSVAEDGRIAARPFPHRTRAGDLGARHRLRFAEVACAEADRAEPELATGLGELLPQPL